MYKSVVFAGGGFGRQLGLDEVMIILVAIRERKTPQLTCLICFIWQYSVLCYGIARHQCWTPGLQPSELGAKQISL